MWLSVAVNKPFESSATLNEVYRQLYYQQYKPLLSLHSVYFFQFQSCFDWISQTNLSSWNCFKKSQRSGRTQPSTTTTTSQRQVRNVDFIVRLISLQTAYAWSLCSEWKENFIWAYSLSVCLCLYTATMLRYCSDMEIRETRERMNK